MTTALPAIAHENSCKIRFSAARPRYRRARAVTRFGKNPDAVILGGLTLLGGDIPGGNIFRDGADSA